MSDSSRRIKLERIMEVRAKELESRVSELSSAQTRQIELQRRLDDARKRRLAALSARVSKVGAGASADDWGQAENWLKGLTEQEWAMRVQNELAMRVVLEARARVARAKTEQDKIQLLLDRLMAEAKGAEARAERKLEDDLLSTQMASKSRAANSRNER